MTASPPHPGLSGRHGHIRRGIGLSALTACVALAGCSKPPPPAPAPPPPPPPAPVAAPSRPIPPNGSSANVPVPVLGADGLRISVNRNITPAQSIWNLRSAWNVAALDCSETTYPEIAPAYRDFLKTFVKELKVANRNVDNEFRAKYGPKFVTQREAFMTQVYNHDALPPTLDEFCKAVGAVGRDVSTIKTSELEPFAVRSLPNIEIVFDAFFRRYVQYQADLAAWEARYAPHDATTPTTVTAADTLGAAPPSPASLPTSAPAAN